MSYLKLSYGDNKTSFKVIKGSRFFDEKSGSDVYTYHYDQLNRIVAMDAFTGLNATTGDFTPIEISDYQERISYDPNGNIMTYTRHGAPTLGMPLQMDSLSYNYNASTNQLDHINDGVPYGNYSTDIDNQNPGNYKYDAIGNLISDDSAGISNIAWTVYGKISTVTKTNGTVINYSYDAAGNRISKTVNATGVADTTVYVRDASGNIMTVYEKTDSLHQSEIDIYGSSRLGVVNPNFNVQRTINTIPLNNGFGIAKIDTFTRGNKSFILSDHRENAMVTVSDKKLQHTSDTTLVDYYNPDVKTATDFGSSSYGSEMPGRTYNIGAPFAYGFNGKRKDDAINGNGVDYDYGMRIYDARIGRFLSVDPLFKGYPWNSPYSYAEGDVIRSVDLDGGEKKIIILQQFVDDNNKVVFTCVDVQEGNNKYNLGKDATLMIIKTGHEPTIDPKTGIVSIYSQKSQSIVKDNSYGIVNAIGHFLNKIFGIHSLGIVVFGTNKNSDAMMGGEVGGKHEIHDVIDMASEDTKMMFDLFDATTAAVEGPGTTNFSKQVQNVPLITKDITATIDRHNGKSPTSPSTSSNNTKQPPVKEKVDLGQAPAWNYYHRNPNGSFNEGDYTSRLTDTVTHAEGNAPDTAKEREFSSPPPIPKHDIQ